MRKLLLLLVLLLLFLAPDRPACGQAMAFRFSTLVLKDAHTFVPVPILGCRDVTDQVPLGLADSINELLAESLAIDKNGNGFVELNPLIYFIPDDVAVGFATEMGGTLWDPAEEDGELVFHLGLCTDPLATTTCDPDINQPVNWVAHANLETGDCLDVLAGTSSSYSPPIVTTSSPCFFTEPFALTIDLAGIPMPMQDVQVGATYVSGNPPRLVDGMLRGFLSEAVADTIILSAAIPFVGGQPLSSILPGGTGCCASGDDRDLSVDGLTVGWWLYFNFEGDEVPFTPATSVPRELRDTAAGLRFGPGLPNPFRNVVTFSYSLPAPGRAALTVLDVSGRRVRSLGERAVRSGTHAASWDGRDHSGALVASGVYFVRLESPFGSRMQRVTLTR